MLKTQSKKVIIVQNCCQAAKIWIENLVFDTVQGVPYKIMMSN